MYGAGVQEVIPRNQGLGLFSFGVQEMGSSAINLPCAPAPPVLRQASSPGGQPRGPHFARRHC